MLADRITYAKSPYDKLFKKVKRGDKEAEFQLGLVLFQKGEYFLAQIFFRRAEEQGHNKAKKYLDNISKRLPRQMQAIN